MPISPPFSTLSPLIFYILYEYILLKSLPCQGLNFCFFFPVSSLQQVCLFLLCLDVFNMLPPCTKFLTWVFLFFSFSASSPHQVSPMFLCLYMGATRLDQECSGNFPLVSRRPFSVPPTPLHSAFSVDLISVRVYLEADLPQQWHRKLHLLFLCSGYHQLSCCAHLRTSSSVTLSLSSDCGRYTDGNCRGKSWS